MKYCTILLFVLSLFTTATYGQFLFNGDLEGEVGRSETPNGWFRIRTTDSLSMASQCQGCNHVGTASSNFRETMKVEPISGNTFAFCGKHGPRNMSGFFHHSGIRQTVNILTVGTTYELLFYQNVVQEPVTPDLSGSWKVYIDDIELGTTETTVVDRNKPEGVWEERSFRFVATNTSHEFKFIVEDDDMNSFDFDGGLQMAIDDIRLFFVTSNDENAISSSIFDIGSIQSNQIVLSFLDINERKTLNMYDALGNRVHHAEIGRSEIGEFGIQNRFSSGVYFLEVITETGRRQIEKIFVP